ncbi:MAG: glucose-1-phosphate cytidylyltransferase [Candidatus Omnitrophica bacterium]|nr:glucose-1-phosphate cytidylyltransferase [Candidatus Omnitrophota bacterium]MBU1047387.1 glucose-1-phosphate cytidylyltransferase [Candidatus Omnitrophota bacterium]MBU1766852.1 glucose-1-phosphate cytidylyltransferase [Candidatus Omnitrophota bacterium]MBU1889028.1 glucose-1-phosphate cytidylyltransferase [Candidatus Omnitrophota bacterium]
MKVVILAGGRGTRLSEETTNIPKPMVEIGGKPIIWHIMKIYSHYGFNDFIICTGYKGYIIKEYFANYFLHSADITLDLNKNKMEVLSSKAEPWKVTLIDTGLDTMTGGRIKKIKKYVGNQTFMLTYGDGIGNINIKESLEFHKKHGKFATITAVQQTGRFGALNIIKSDDVKSFFEKPKGDRAWINGGFFVLEPKIFEYIKNDSTEWEKEPLENLAKNNQLNAYKHNGFWKCMDTLRDKIELEQLWNANNALWKFWKA